MRIVLDVREEIELIRLNAVEWAAGQATNPSLSERDREILGNFGYIRPYQWAEILVMFLKDSLSDRTGIRERVKRIGHLQENSAGDQEVEDFLDNYVCDQVYEKLHLISRALSPGTIWQLRPWGVEFCYELVYVGQREILEPAIRKSGGSFRKFLDAIQGYEDKNQMHQDALKEMSEEHNVIHVRLTDRILAEQLELPEDHPNRWHRRLEAEIVDSEPEEETNASAQPTTPADPTAW